MTANTPTSDPEGSDPRWAARVRARVSGASMTEDSPEFSPEDDLPTWEDWRQYVALVTWLIPDVLRHASAKTIGVALLSSIGVGARAGSIGAILLFVHALNRGEAATILGVELPTGTTLWHFVVWGSLTLGFALISISASYKADSLIFGIAGDYMKGTTSRVMRYISAGGEVRLPGDLHEQGPRPTMRLLVGDTFRLVRVVIQTLSMVLPLVTLAACLAVLLATNAKLTAFLIPVLAIYAGALAHLNRGVLRDSQRRELGRRRHSRDVARMLRTLRTTRYLKGSRPAWLVNFPSTGWMETAMGAFRGIVLAKRRVDYLGDAFQGVALMVVLMAFGTYVASDQSSWAILLSYLIALGYGTRSMGRVSKCVTTANRFLPQVRRYVAFIQSHPDPRVYEERLARGLEQNEVQLRVSEPIIPESQSGHRLVPGDPIFCAYFGPYRSSRLGEFCFALAGGDPAEAIAIEADLFFLRAVSSLPERRLRDYLPPSEQPAEQWKHALDALEALGVRDEFDTKLRGGEAILDVGLEETLSPALRVGIRLLPGLLSTARFFVFDWEMLTGLSSPERQRLLQLVSGRILMLVSTEAPKEMPAELRHAMVVDRVGVRGIGDADWYSHTAVQHLPTRDQDSEELEESDLGHIGDDADDEEDE